MKNLQTLTGLMLMTGLTACSLQQTTGSSAESTNSNTLLTLVDFESDHYKTMLTVTNGSSQLVTDNGQGVSQGKQALQLDMAAKQNYLTAFTLAPQDNSTWDWSQYQNFSLAIDITNPLDESTHMYLEVADSDGKLHRRSVNVGKNSSQTYHVELSGYDLGIESGMRANPDAFETNAKPFLYRWGATKEIDLSAVKHIQFSAESLLSDRRFIIDNIRLVQNPKYDQAYLKGLVDEYGQAITAKFPQKVSNDQDLAARTKRELSHLSDKLFSDRSQYGGWAQGPKLEATGYFRTTKYKGKWALVDPEGYLFFSNGIANVRMANTSTMTGIDFDKALIPQRSKDDLTPEDSVGLNRITGKALSTRHVNSEMRNNMFSWLPDYHEPLAKHYGYRREAHIGAVESGETYSFYQANLERKYGDNFMQTWKDITLKRMRNWGFTSFGNWIDPMFYHENQLPYFANGWIIGNFKKVSSGADYWAPMPDPFDPLFAERVRATVKQVASEVQNSPWCIGVFVDNEKSWGRMGSIETQYGIVINTLGRATTDSPTKAHYSQLLRQQYQTIDKLNASWNSQIASWQAFDQGVKVKDFTDSQVKDFSTLLSAYADQYFKIVRQETKQQMPNHLYMGARFAPWGMTPEVLNAAVKYTDVMSFNYYREGLHPEQWAFLEEIDMPSVIGEFHFGADDTGLYHPGAVLAQDQQDRAQKYQGYLNSVIDNPYMVGAHWFQYVDSPTTGRAHDGENYNVGFVTSADIPYQPLVDKVKEVNGYLYQRKFGNQ
ncbi:agarase [Saccharobesus litoralis]|uniref:Agarase n=1 Tax=Saccharobesus litoralis TaxID=2172099 RepID=A0A2S0VN50_9ALTE|nr:beta-galactosidase [Saccharobesus litoralis]AWB65644.1 agarase [Saccharobesus litoralis]